MNVELLKQALHNREVSSEASVAARNVGVCAREQTHVLVERMNAEVQLNVAKAVGATVEIRSREDGSTGAR